MKSEGISEAEKKYTKRQGHQSSPQSQALPGTVLCDWLRLLYFVLSLRFCRGRTV